FSRDWSSDVCSSDLAVRPRATHHRKPEVVLQAEGDEQQPADDRGQATKNRPEHSAQKPSPSRGEQDCDHTESRVPDPEVHAGGKDRKSAVQGTTEDD